MRLTLTYVVQASLVHRQTPSPSIPSAPCSSDSESPFIGFGNDSQVDCVPSPHERAPFPVFFSLCQRAQQYYANTVTAQGLHFHPTDALSFSSLSLLARAHQYYRIRPRTLTRHRHLASPPAPKPLGQKFILNDSYSHWIISAALYCLLTEPRRSHVAGHNTLIHIAHTLSRHQSILVFYLSRAQHTIPPPSSLYNVMASPPPIPVYYRSLILRSRVSLSLTHILGDAWHNSQPLLYVFKASLSILQSSYVPNIQYKLYNRFKIYLQSTKTARIIWVYKERFHEDSI